MIGVTRPTVDFPATVILSRPLDKPAFRTVPEMVFEWAERTPRAIAIETSKENYSYSDLESIVSELVRHLEGMGIRKGDTVGLAGAASLGMISGLIALFRLQAIAAPIDPMIPQKRRDMILSLGKSRLLLNVGLEPTLDASVCPALAISPATGRVVSTPAGFRAAEGGDSVCLDIDGDPAYLFFTSGTSGEPRGVVGSGQSLAHFMNWQRELFGKRGNLRAAQFTRASFDVFLRDALLPLVSGGTLCIPGGNESFGLGTFSWLAGKGITHFHAVPTLAQRWLAAMDGKVSLPSLETIFFAGEPLLGGFLLKWKENVHGTYQIVNMYGPTETTLAKFFHRVEKIDTHGVQPVGRPLPQTQAFVISKEEILRDSGEGEIVIRTAFPSLSLIGSERKSGGGFFENPCQSAPSDRLYRTGDWGRLDGNGRLEVLHRVDGQIKVNGVRVNPEEIAAVLSTHPSIKAAVAVVQENRSASGAKFIAAYFIPEGKGSLDPAVWGDELRRFLGERLPGGMIPAFIIPIEGFPVTSNGKLDRVALQDLLSGSEPVREADATCGARTNIEKLRGIWLKFLPVGFIGNRENFFEAGGDSLSAIQVLDDISRSFGIKCGFGDLLAHPTVSSFFAAMPTMPPIDGCLETIENPGTRYPLSPQQNRFFKVYLPVENRSWCNMLMSIPVPEAIATTDIQECLVHICARHDSLRARFLPVDGILCQIFEESPNIPLEEIDMRDDGSHAASLALRSRLAAFNSQLIDIRQAPLFRALMVRDAKGITLYMNFHHLIFDGFSSALLRKEMTALFEARMSARPPSLPALASSYREFILQQLEIRKNIPLMDAKRRYWLDTFGGIKSAYRLSPEGGSDRDAAGATFAISLPSDLETAAASAAKSGGTTPFVIYLSAFAAALGRTFAKEEAIISVPYAGRETAAHLDLIGNFISIITLRIALEPQVRDFPAEVGRVLASCIENQIYQVDDLLQDLRLEVNGQMMPLSTVLFNTATSPEKSEPTGPGGAHSDMGVDVRYELMGVIKTTPGGSTLLLQYRPALLARRIIERLAESFLERLTAIAHPWLAPSTIQNAENTIIGGDSSTMESNMNADSSGKSESRKAILEALRDVGGTVPEGFSGTENIFEKANLDSMQTILLLTKVEERMGIVIGEEISDLDRVGTLDGFIELVAEKIDRLRVHSRGAKRGGANG